MSSKPHKPDDTDGSAQSGHHTLGPRRTQATPGNHRHLIGSPQEGFISETLFDPDTDIINGSYSGTAFKQLLDLLEQYGLTNDSTEIVGSGNWKWTDAQSGDPGAKYVGDNATLSPDATQVRISKDSNDGRTITGAALVSGNLFMILGAAAAGGYEIVAAVDMGTWFDVEVNYLRGSGNFVDQEVVTVALYPGASGHDHPEYLEPTEVVAGAGIDVTENPPGTVVITNTEPGVLDHGSLLGLTDDDHPQYLMESEVIAGTNITIDRDLPVVGSITISSEGGGGGLTEVVYLWESLSVVSDPGSGYVGVDVNNPDAATKLQISAFDSSGANKTSILSLLIPGDILVIQSQTHVDRTYRYVVTATPTDNTTWWSIPIRVDATGTGSEPNDNSPVNILVAYASGGGGGTGADETYYQSDPPASPAVGDIWVDADGVTSLPPVVTNIPVGMMGMFAGSVAPAEWLLADGRAVSRTTYQELFQVIGTTFGGGNGTTTFNLPLMTGNRFMRGNTSPGSMGGSNTHSHPGTDWRTGNTNIGGTNNTDAAPNGTGNGNGAPDGTGTNGDHDHNVPGSDAAHSHGIGSDGSHGHSTGDPSSITTVPGSTGIKVVASGNHGHNVGSGGSHNHGGTGTSQANHNHGRTGSNGNHSHSVPNSVHSHSVPGSNHSHGIPGSNHDHNIPTSTDESNQPLYTAFLPCIYAGV